MRVLLFCGALFIVLIGTCRGEPNDETINIDDLVAEEAAIAAELMLDELSGDGPNGITGDTTDDEDLATDLLEGSGTDVNNIVDVSLTTISSKITIANNNNNVYEVGPTYTENETRNKNGNDALGGAKPNDVAEKPQNFFERIFKNPAILAGMVGAVVLILLTVVLVFLFVIYRIKKKDEGSYSLDEPHKVKDPTAYWKDTKEFYA